MRRTAFLPFHVPDIGDEEVSAVAEALRSGWLTTGPKVHAFEQAFASYIGAPHAVAVNSGTAALHLALEAIGLAEGDDVLVPTMTFAATAEVVTALAEHLSRHLCYCSADVLQVSMREQRMHRQ